MRKQEFLEKLRNGLSGLPQYDIEERLTFYSEMIDDRMEEGLTEEAAVCEIGAVEDVVSQIISETPLSKLVKEKVKPKRSFQAWEIVLLVLGSPIWLSLLAAVFLVVLAVYIVIWSAVILLWAVEVSLAACSIGGLLSPIIYIFQGNGLGMVAMLGAGICCAGLMILLFFGCMAVSKGILMLTKKIVFRIKTVFVGKEDVQ